MAIKWKDGSKYHFRKCDVAGLTETDVTAMAMETGYIQYEPYHVWLVIPGIGYGLREDYC